jgi:hypothetical protein
MSNATAIAHGYTHTAPTRSAASPSTAARAERSLVPAAVFCATLALGFAAAAISPELVNREYASALFMTPLALAAGTCFGGILSLVVFFDEKHA